MKKAGDEHVWTNLRFVLLLMFSVIVVSTILFKFVFHIPHLEHDRYMSDIRDMDRLMSEQTKCADRLSDLAGRIDSIDFSIQQVQLLDEIKEESNTLQESYRKNNNNSKYIFSVHAFRAARYFFDCKEELSNISQNNEIIEQYLEECKANL